MTIIDRKYKKHMVVSCKPVSHNERMRIPSRNNTTTSHSLREALGPGFGLFGPSEDLLKAVADGGAGRRRRSVED